MSKFFTILFLFLAAVGFGQYDMEEAKEDSTITDNKISTLELKENIYVGGNLSLSFGNQIYLMLQPLAGYEIWGGISAGVNAMYQLNRFTFNNGSAVSYHAYGGGIFARWRPPNFQYLLLQTEFDLYNTEDLESPFIGERTTIPAFYGGIGYAGGFGRAYYQIMLKYDFIDNPSMPLPRFFGDFPLYISYGMVFYLA